ncbi:MAG: hypothetical protein M1115_01190 [Actinobacteria bacterium]|nr:hypothetical protein [Actinomycetota bacterium]
MASEGSFAGAMWTASGTLPTGVSGERGGRTITDTVCWPPGNSEIAGGSRTVKGAAGPIAVRVNCSTIEPVLRMLSSAASSPPGSTFCDWDRRLATTGT